MADTYTLTYNGNADGLGQMNEDKLEGTTVELSQSFFTRIGYIFGYWSVSPDGSGITYYPGDPFQMPSSNVTLFAVWRDDNIINQAFIDVGVTLKQNVNYIMTSDVTMTVPFQFTEPGTGITFDGQGQKINVIGTGTWPGLFSKPVTVQTVGILSARSTAASAGWFFATTVGGSATNCYSTGPIGQDGGGIFGSESAGSATNCYSSGPIGDNAGGILGASSSGSATNCYSTGTIGNNGGGIFGNGSSSTPTNCYSLDGANWSDADANNNLIGYPGSSDPQVWSSVGADTPYLLLSNPQTSSNTNLTSVVVNGEILTPNSGIYTYSFPLNATSTSVTITSEEPHAAITISNIVGDFPGYHIVTIDPLALSDGINSSTITVLALDGTTTDTYTLVINVPIEITQSVIDVAGFSLLDSTTYIMTEDVSMGSPFLFADGATGFGIIFDGSGHTVGVTGLGTDTWTGLFSNAVTVQNVGILSAERSTAASAGWFFANGVGGSTTNCYSTGTIGPYGGGIFGTQSNGTATNCYSTGIIGEYGGGIFGYYSSGSATNCYSTGTIGTDGGGIFGAESTGTATNCYIVNGELWSDISANNSLIGYPGLTDPVWSSVIPNTPYLLVDNPQPSSNDAQLSKVLVNGILRTNISGSYKYIFNTSATLLPISIVTNESHAFVRIQDLSGYGNLSGFLTIDPAIDTFTLPITVSAQTGVSATSNLIINKSVPVLIDQAFIDAGTSLVINTPYFMTADVSMNSPFLFEDDNTGIMFDGSGHTINVSGSGTWAGLFSKAVTVRNVGILSTRSTAESAGWFFANGVGGSTTNCYSTGTIGDSGGGIFGEASSGSALNCYSTGIIGEYGGGIFGNNSSGSATATNCYSTGIIGEYGGGIVGYNSSGSATNCYSTGTIGPQAGGIYGAEFTGTATNFYIVNGGLWIDASANEPTALTDLSGSTIGTAVWFRYNDVPDTPYLLVANPQPPTIYNPSNDDDLSLVAINGTTVDILEGQYNYSFISNASSVPVRVTTNEPNARARIVVSDLSGSNDLSGSLLINPGPNVFSIDVVAQSGASTDYPLTIQVSLPTVYINQAFIDAGAALVNYTPYVMTADVSMNDPFTFASPSVTGITFDGSGHTINVRGSGTWAGLFSNAVTVQNVGILSTRSTAASAGWFFADGVAGSATNCYSTGAIGQDGGGIFGQNSSGSATNCYSAGTIGQEAGGIFGSGSLGPAENCYSTGDIGGGAGGICGHASYGPATNCYSTGTIGYRGGGIFGRQSAGAATNCYSTGTIGLQADGIFGYQSSGSATNFYILNGQRWSDASANEGGSLIGYLSMPVVWSSVGANTPYLLLSNPQTSSNTNLTSVVVNGETLPIDSDPFRYYLTTYAASTPVAITTQEPHALITITNSAGDTVLDGYNILDSSLSSLVVGLNTFTISTTALDGTTNSHLLKIYNNTVEINQAFIDESSTLMDNVAYIISGNVNMGSPFLFAVGATGAGITVNGDGYTVTVPTNNWPGLFSKPVTVLNVGILSTQSTAQNAGWFFADGVGGSTTNCYSTGPIGSNGGGIFGRQSNGTAANCYSEGAIGKNGGGFFGEQSTGTATNCHSTGAIDQDAGGIFGEQSTGTALGCFTIGDISSNGGGIFGQGSNGPATNCYSIGAIGQFAGGIFGRNSESNATAANCYSTGTIDVSGGGIFGPRVGAPPTPSNCYVVNGGLWSDASANNNLIGYPGSAPPIVWTSVGADTPYLLLSNPQISSNINLTSVLVDGATLTANLGVYSYSFVSLTDSTSVAITSEEPHAFITITDSTGGLVLSDYHILTDPLPLSDGLNTFIITVRALDGTTLATHPLVINTPVEITQTVIDVAEFSLLDSTIYIMTEDVEMTVPFQFAEGATGTEILFDGSGHTINVIGEGEGEWLGLFSNALTVQNVGILSTRSNATGAGWFFANNLGGSATNCYSTGPIGTYGGGIFGSQSIGTATNCYSTGDIGYAAGGIVGLQSTGSAINCYSIGPIGTYGGGIFGGQSGGTATNCYSTGAFGESVDGIFGAESSSSPVNCYSLNGARWSDASANAVDSLINYSTVWRSVGANTPYLLISNPQSSSNTNLTSVVVNGETLIANSGTYSYTFFDPTDLTSVAITSQEPHAKITITDSTGDTVLDGYHIVTGSLTPLVVGPNSFTITVLALDNSTHFTPTLTITVRGPYTAAEIAMQMDLDKVAAVFDNNTPGQQENSALIAVTALQTLYNENQSKTQNVNSNIPQIEDYTA